MVLACTESSRYSTFWVMAVGKALRFRNCRHGRCPKRQRELVFKNHMELVNEYMGAFALLPVLGHTVQHGVRDDQQAVQPRPQTVNVEYNHTLVKVYIVLLAEMSKQPVVYSSRERAICLASGSGCSSRVSRRVQRVGTVPESGIPVNHRNTPVDDGFVLGSASCRSARSGT